MGVSVLHCRQGPGHLPSMHEWRWDRVDLWMSGVPGVECHLSNSSSGEQKKVQTKEQDIKQGWLK